MTISHSPYAPTNPYAPEPVGVCDRCGFLWPLARLNEQLMWAGTAVVGTGLRVCPKDNDVLQPNGHKAIFLGPEPRPLRNARPSPLWGRQARVPAAFVLDDGAEFSPEFDEEFVLETTAGILNVDYLDGTAPGSDGNAPLDQFILDTNTLE